LKIALRVAASLAILISLTACASSKAGKPGPAAPYTFRHKDFDLRYAWNTSQTDQGIRIDGIVKSVRYASMDDLEVNVALLDKDRKVIGQGSTFVAPPALKIDDLRGFNLLIKDAKLSPGDMLQFVVDYKATESYNGVNWHGGFTVNAMTGAPIGVGRSPEEEW